MALAGLASKPIDERLLRVITGWLPQLGKQRPHWEGWERGYLRQERATDWAGGDYARWRRAALADVWATYVDALERAGRRAEVQRASEPAPEHLAPRLAPDENSTHVVLTEAEDYFFPTLKAAEEWTARNVGPTYSGRLTIQTIEGYNLQRAWQRDAA